jgi:hypothetical protein
MSIRIGCRSVSIGLLALLAAGPLALAAEAAPGSEKVAAAIETEYVKYVLGADGRSLHFIDKKSGTDYCQTAPAAPVARITVNGKEHPASSAKADGDLIMLGFGETGVRAAVKFVRHPGYFVVEVVSLEGAGVEVFTFLDLPLTLKAKPGEPLAACALALNLRTNVAEIPQPVSRLRAMCHRRFGFAGAQTAVVACPPDQLRKVLQEVVTKAPDLPHSPIGGPWAMDHDVNRGSYLFDFGDLNEKTVDDWIKLARQLAWRA